MDAYEVDILHSKGKLKFCAKNGFKLMNLYVDYNYTLAKIKMNLVVLANKLNSLNFFCFDIFEEVALSADQKYWMLMKPC